MDDPSDGWINARSETAHEKPAFRRAWDDRPCLVLSSGFYEWQDHGRGPKTPYRIHREDDTAFAMAGLWEERTDGDTTARSVTILTTGANELMAPIHDRMPVILPERAEREWLTSGPDDRRDFCHPYRGDDLAAYRISTQVNNPDTDVATVIEPASETQSSLGNFS